MSESRHLAEVYARLSPMLSQPINRASCCLDPRRRTDTRLVGGLHPQGKVLADTTE
jgi:hypothetical protein